MQHWSSCERSVLIAAQPGRGPNGYVHTIREPRFSEAADCRISPTAEDDPHRDV